MKLRAGYVSNSSSSSFIVAFEKVPTTKKELKEVLFGKREEYHSPFNNEVWSTEDVAEKVWTDLAKKTPATLESIIDTIKSGEPALPEWLWALPEFRPPDWPSGDYTDKDWEEYNRKREELALRLLRMMPEAAINEGRVFIFSYSDNENEMEAAMEHGDLFRSADSCLRISNH